MPHCALLFLERWDAEQWQSLRGDQGILGFLGATKHSRGLQSPGQSGRQPGWQPVPFTQYITVVIHQDDEDSLEGEST